jgi:hypothetical protein
MSIEVQSDTPMGAVLMRMNFEPDGAAGWKLTSAKMQMGTSPVQEMPPPPSGGGIKKNDTPGKLVGSESVTTPAGTFACKHYQRAAKGAGDTAMDFWVNEKALPTGLVKMTAANGAEAVLTNTGGDAKARLN